MTDIESNNPVYLGFIQGLCWATGAHNGVPFNEPNELWDGKDYFDFDLIRFFEVFSDYDEEGTIMKLRRVDDDHGYHWEIWCTESEGYPDTDEAEDKLELLFPTEWLRIYRAAKAAKADRTGD